MACNITIHEVVGIVPAGQTTPAVVRVSGTASACERVLVTVACDAAPGSVEGAAPVQPDGTWTTDVKIPCPCDGTTHVRALCAGDPTCADTFEGNLRCLPEEDRCPTVSVQVTTADFGGDDVGPSPCNPDGTQTVTLTVTIVPPGGGGTVVTQWDFGDGSFGPASTSLNYTVTHDYTPPGPYTATLNIVLPENCPPTSVVIDGLGPCDCPEVFNPVVEVTGCAGGGNAANATVSGTPSGPTDGCEYRWEWGDGSPEQVTTSPSASHAYTTPGAYPAAVVLVCGSCIRITTFTVVVPPCCPLATGLSVSIEGCAGGGNSASVTFIAATDPPSAPGTYEWSFGDGASQTTSVPTVTHLYGTPGSRNVSVTFTPAQGGCSPSAANTTVDVPRCNGQPPPPPPLDEGSGCKGLRWAIVILSALAAIALYICLCVPAAASAFCWIAAGLAAAAAVVALIWGFLCPKPCGWGLLLAWQVGLAAGIGALYFAPCCPWLWVVGAGLVAAALVTMGIWIRRCRVPFCSWLAELAVVLAGVIVPALGWIAGIPFLAVCVNPIVAAGVATLSGIVAVLLAQCATRTTG